MTVSSEVNTPDSAAASVLHICKREILRPLRDQILRLSGFEVESTLDTAEALSLFRSSDFDLILIDVESEASVHDAETICAELRTEKPGQLVAFVCNWRVAALSDCPDDIVRTEFNPAAFVQGVKDVLARH